jgi:hypothetical protein
LSTPCINSSNSGTGCSGGNFDIQIAADIGDHLLATRHRAFDLGIELKAEKV